MLIKVLRAKIHRAVATAADPDYIGSIAIDRELMAAAGLAEGECVLVANLANGTRHETYVIPGEPGSGEVCVNGAAARLVQPGDRLIIMAFGYVPVEQAGQVRPNVIVVDDKNHQMKKL
ncbi:MAG TPA: aspartate 1-decarboxylase [Phycisphaerae bacterium]|nr:aspartate 1-decarboxylase [Phycisphaerae bacterium]